VFSKGDEKRGQEHLVIATTHPRHAAGIQYDQKTSGNGSRQIVGVICSKWVTHNRTYTRLGTSMAAFDHHASDTRAVEVVSQVTPQQFVPFF
jgi:hypothetical protein